MSLGRHSYGVSMVSSPYRENRPNGSPRITTNAAPNEPMNLLDPPIDIIDEEPSLRERVNEILLPDEDTIPDWDSDAEKWDGLMITDDPCCSAAKDAVAQAWATTPGMKGVKGDMSYSGIRSSLGRMDCDQFRQMMEDDTSRSMGRYSPLSTKRVRDRDRKILADWDACAAQGFSGDFTASQDPMEAGWGHIVKWDDNEPQAEFNQTPPFPPPIRGFIRPLYDINMPEFAQMTEDDDPCCSEARELLATYLSEKAQNEPVAVMANAMMGLYEEIMRGGGDWSCEDIQQKMERWAQGSDWERKVANAVLDAWNKCSEKTRLGDTIGTFTASDDPFEVGWGLILKYSVYDDLPDDAPVGGLVTTHSGIGAPEVAAKRVGTKPLLSMDGWDQSIRTLDANHPGKHLQQWFSPETLQDTLGHIHDATTGGDSWAFHASPLCAKIARSNLHGTTDPHGAMEGMRFVGDIMDNIREWENPPSMMTVEQSPDVIPYMLDARRRANQGISEDFKSMVRNNPTLTSSMFGSPTTRRRMWAAEGTKATPTHTDQEYLSINDLLPGLAQEWHDSETKDAELEHLRQSGRVGAEGMKYLSEAPSLAFLESINPGKERAVWNDDKKSMAFKHLSRLDKPIPGLRHHGAVLTNTRMLTPEEMLQIQGWTGPEAKAFNFPQRLNETYDANAGTGKRKRPVNVIRTQIGNTLSPNIYENLLRNVGLGQQRLY